MQLPAQLTDVVDAQGPDADSGHLDLRARQPREGRVAEVGRSERCEQVARSRTGHDQRAPGLAHVGNLHGLVVAPGEAEQVEVPLVGHRAGEQEEPVGPEARDRELRREASAVREGVGEHDAAVPARHAVGAQAIEEHLSTRAGDLELGEARELNHADPLAHRPAFRGHDLEQVVVPERALLLAPVEREPLRTLPAVALGEHATLGLERLVKGRRLRRTTLGPLFAGWNEPVHVRVLAVRLDRRVGLVGEGAEPARVHAQHVDLGRPVHHPLGQVLATARALGDPDAGAGGQPEVAHAGRRTHQRVAVRRVRDRPVHDLLDADLVEDRHPLHDPLEVEGDGIPLCLEQLVRCVPGRAPHVGPGLARVAPLVDADQARLDLLPVVGGGVGVAHHGDLDVAVEELGDGFRHEVLVLHVGERRLDPEPGADAVGVAARGVHHVLAGDLALLGGHPELATGEAFDPGDPIGLDDRGPELDGSERHRVAGARRVDVAVIQRPGAGQHAVGRHERVDPPDLLGADDLHPEPDVGGHALDPLEVVQLLQCRREPDPADAPPASRLACHRLQARVQVVAVGVDLGQVEVGDEARALSGRVPRGSRGQLGLLDEDRVGPALQGEVVEEADAHDAPAHDHDACSGSHGQVLVAGGIQAGQSRSPKVNGNTALLRGSRWCGAGLTRRACSKPVWLTGPWGSLRPAPVRPRGPLLQSRPAADGAARPSPRGLQARSPPTRRRRR